MRKPLLIGVLKERRLQALLCLLLSIYSLSCNALTSAGQQPRNWQDSTQSPKRLTVLAYSGAATYTGLLIGLNTLWYAEHPQTGFHFFDDSKQWMGVDKAGHAYTSYHLSRSGAEALRWAGLSPQRASIYGSIGGWLFMLPIEVLDGFSAEYGASWTDLAANSFGSLLYGGQMLWWEEVRVKPKFSFHPTSFAGHRPNTLGDKLPAQLLKDYNGQTYWLSVDIEKFLPKENSFPPWLNIAFGYGTEGMVYAHPDVSREAGFTPYAQFYLAPDIDLSHLRSKKRLINWLLFALDAIHLPTPAIEYSQNSWRLHALYF